MGPNTGWYWIGFFLLMLVALYRLFNKKKPDSKKSAQSTPRTDAPNSDPKI
jgi:hypothetical protein